MTVFIVALKAACAAMAGNGPDGQSCGAPGHTMVTQVDEAEGSALDHRAGAGAESLFECPLQHTAKKYLFANRAEQQCWQREHEVEAQEGQRGGIHHPTVAGSHRHESVVRAAAIQQHAKCEAGQRSANARQ
jgi:hypothetical protein